MSATKWAVARGAAARIAALARQHRACVQAGGHIGFWPKALSQYFAAVYTFEPDAENFAVLVQNAHGATVFAARGALGQHPHGVHLERDVPKSGHWYSVPGGPIPTYTVDGLALDAVDALVLDVEGAELSVLKGAEQTILRDHPVIWYEANGYGEKRGSAAIAEWVADRGYGRPVPGLGCDVYVVPA